MSSIAFPPQQQEPPGLTSEMTPTPDHGEDSYRGNDRLRGKRALVTGGDSGIGRAVAIAFAREGASVAITHLPAESEDAADTVAFLSDEGAKAVAIESDLQTALGCREAVARTVTSLGGIDVLVNNAGHQWARDDRVEDISDGRLDQVIDTNLKALIRLTRDSVPYLKRSRGSIINVSSIQAYEPSTTLLDYAATKAAINNLTVNLAAELGPFGIRVNSVAPGPIWTPLQPATQTNEKLTHFGEDTPLGRAGQPAECAPAFVFLADDTSASYVSGTVLGVTGGKPVF